MTKFMTQKILLSVIIAIICFSPINIQKVLGDDVKDQYLKEYIIDSEAVWKGKVDIKNNYLITKKGRLIIKSGTEITFYPNTSIDVVGELSGQGRLIKPIRIKGSENNSRYTIRVGGKAIIRNAEISQGGGTLESYLLGIRRSFWQKVVALVVNRIGAISVTNGGTFECQNCFFHDNKIAVYAGTVFDMGSSKNSQITVNRSSFQNNEKDIYIENTQGEFNFKYNWWGNKLGPVAGKNKGKNIQTDYWRKEKEFKDPVVIVPGILGSWRWSGRGKLRLDPIFKTYQNLLRTFQYNGYLLDDKIFTFPYNWRGSNIATAKLLKEKIAEIKEKTHWPKVDIVAHSMGGLVARQYIELEDYENDVDQLIMLGTPNGGAPKSYLNWEGDKAVYAKTVKDAFLNNIFTQEAKENGYNNIYEYVHGVPIWSIKELLPDYSYLKNYDSQKLRQYYNNYPRNEFLEELNSLDNLKKLQQVETDLIVGKTKKLQTINYIKVEDGFSFYPLWKHGYPQGLNKLTGNHGMEMGDGDGTVPLFSARNLPADKIIETNYNHRRLVMDTGDIIYNLLTNKRAHSLEEDLRINYSKNILLFMVFSPIDIQIIAPDGKRVGKNFETGGFYDEIEGAYYTGYKTDTEFITIPNPIDGEYKILTQGTDDGNYKIETTDISKDGEGKVTEKTLIFEGTTSLDEKFQHQFTIENSNILDIKTADASDDENIEDNNDNEGVVDENNSEILSENNNEELQLNNNSNEELAIAENNNENSKNNKHKKKKHKKKKKHNKKIALANSKDKNNNLRTNYADVNTKKFENKELANNIEKNETKNTVMGEDTTNNKKVSDKQDTTNKQNKSWYAFGAVILIGIFLAIGNLFGWLKIKKKKEDKNDF